MRVTVAGEDGRFCAQLAELLEGQGYAVATIARVGRVVEALRAAPPQLLVVVKPFLKDTLAAFLHAVRGDARLRAMAILCVNPKGSSAEGVACLDAGADDFIHRPFNPQIFLARARTLLRRALASAGAPPPDDSVTILQGGGVTLQLLSRHASLGEQPLALTRLEFDLLAYLLRFPETVFSRQDILEAVWNYPGDVETRTLEKHVENLRRKLGPAGDFIQTVHGVGYRFLPPPTRKSPRR